MKSALTTALRALLRSTYRATVPGSVRDAVRLQRQLVQQEREPVMADPPARSRILVLAPHMDDEVFACGGTLARAVAAGSEVRVLYITDGSRGYDPAKTTSMTEAELRDFERELVETRKAEACRAGAILGFADPLFLDLPDGRLADASDAPERLSHLMEELASDTVFLPFPADSHPDHWAANRLFVDAVAGSKIRPSTPCWGYEVWTPLVANAFVDVTAVMERKQQAMGVFESQNIDVDYPRVITALNAYRSLAAGLSSGYAEAFFVTPVTAYCKLFRQIWPRGLLSKARS